MHILLIYPIIGLLFGLIAGAIVRPLVCRRWPVVLAAVLVPLPFVFAFGAFGLAFMRDDSSTVGSLVSLTGYILLLVWPGSLLAAYLICRESARRR